MVTARTGVLNVAVKNVGRESRQVDSKSDVNKIRTIQIKVECPEHRIASYRFRPSSSGHRPAISLTPSSALITRSQKRK